jgi:glutamate-1-semialdehyde 2,1-aminomutase
MPSARTIYASDITWCDDVGINTAIETINKHRSKKIGNYIRSIGRYFQEKLEIIAKKNNMPIKISGLPSLTQFDFAFPITKDNHYDKYNEFADKTCYSYGNVNNLLRTLYIQLMLERHILADTFYYPSFVHTFKRTDYYLEHISDVFKLMREHLENRTIHKVLLSQPAKRSYQMLT